MKDALYDSEAMRRFAGLNWALTPCRTNRRSCGSATCWNATS